MLKIFSKASDKNVESIQLYVSNSNLYYDSSYSNEVLKDDLLDMFKKGKCLILTGTGEWCRPTAAKAETAYATVSVVTVASSTASVVTYYSDAHNA